MIADERAQELTRIMENNLWGYSTPIDPGKPNEPRNPVIPNILKNRARSELNPLSVEAWKYAYKNKNNSLLRDFIGEINFASQEGRGDLRFLITVLAMINSTPLAYERQPRSGSYRYRLRNLPYFDNTLVKIDCGNKKRAIKFVGRALNQALHHIRMRAHDVRGHFRTLHKGTNQEKRVWIKEHQRGDASLGFVHQKYEVTASQ
jgi:hypothetical protein